MEINNGIVVQYGIYSNTTTGFKTINLPFSYATANYFLATNLTQSNYNAFAYATHIQSGGYSTTKSSFQQYTDTNLPKFRWLTLGY